MFIEVYETLWNGLEEIGTIAGGFDWFSLISQDTLVWSGSSDEDPQKLTPETSSSQRTAIWQVWQEYAFYVTLTIFDNRQVMKIVMTTYVIWVFLVIKFCFPSLWDSTCCRSVRSCRSRINSHQPSFRPLRAWQCLASCKEPYNPRPYLMEFRKYPGIASGLGAEYFYRDDQRSLLSSPSWCFITYCTVLHCRVDDSQSMYP